MIIKEILCEAAEYLLTVNFLVTLTKGRTFLLMHFREFEKIIECFRLDFYLFFLIKSGVDSYILKNFS